MEDEVEIGLERNINILRGIVPFGRCRRRQIACVLTDDNWKVVSSSANGTESALGNCYQKALCPDAEIKAGEGAYRHVRCWGVHAEQFAVACAFASARRPTISLTNKAPCPACLQLLYFAGVRTIIFETDSNDQDSREVAKRLGMNYFDLTKARDYYDNL